MRKLIPLLVLLLLITYAAIAAHWSATVTEETYSSVKKVTWVWISNATNIVEYPTDNVYTGKILGLATEPDGTAAPTHNYDLTITDENGLDVLAGQGANKASASIQYVYDESLLGAVANDKLMLNVSNAGAAKSGTTYLFIR